MTVEEYVMFHERWKGAVACAEMRGWRVRSHEVVEHFVPRDPPAMSTNTSGVVLHGSWRIKEDAKIEVHDVGRNLAVHTFYRTQDGLEKLLKLLAETGTI